MISSDGNLMVIGRSGTGKNNLCNIKIICNTYDGEI